MTNFRLSARLLLAIVLTGYGCAYLKKLKPEPPPTLSRQEIKQLADYLVKKEMSDLVPVEDAPAPALSLLTHDPQVVSGSTSSITGSVTSASVEEIPVAVGLAAPSLSKEKEAQPEPLNEPSASKPTNNSYRCRKYGFCD